MAYLGIVVISIFHYEVKWFHACSLRHGHLPYISMLSAVLSADPSATTVHCTVVYSTVFVSSSDLVSCLV
jgi:hypothetical protein